jgi:hypothetical protein
VGKSRRHGIMSDEYENISSRMPDMNAMLAKRIAQKQGTVSTIPTDPYQILLKKKESENAPIDPNTIKKWPDVDMKRLEDYCQRMGIIGFNPGKMHPMAALRMLTQQYGEDFSGVPLEERIPAGYQKLGTPGEGYSSAGPKKQILHG